MLNIYTFKAERRPQVNSGTYISKTLPMTHRTCGIRILLLRAEIKLLLEEDAATLLTDAGGTFGAHPPSLSLSLYRIRC